MEWGLDTLAADSKKLELSLLIKLILNRQNDTFSVSNTAKVKQVELIGVEVEGGQTSRSSEPSTNENYSIRLKEILIILFILSIWMYSIYRFFKVWRDILNFSAESLQRSQNPPDNFWTWAITYIRSLKKSKLNGEEIVLGRYSPTPVDQARRAKAIMERRREMLNRRKSRGPLNKRGQLNDMMLDLDCECHEVETIPTAADQEEGREEEHSRAREEFAVENSQSHAPPTLQDVREYEERVRYTDRTEQE